MEMCPHARKCSSWLVVVVLCAPMLQACASDCNCGTPPVASVGLQFGCDELVGVESALAPPGNGQCAFPVLGDEMGEQSPYNLGVDYGAYALSNSCHVTLHFRSGVTYSTDIVTMLVPAVAGCCEIVAASPSSVDVPGVTACQVDAAADARQRD